MPTNKIDLRNVTLCSVDCLNPILASRALTLSEHHCRFGETLLLTDKPIDTHARLVSIPSIRSTAEYSAFILKKLAGYISTPWVLIVQWDGFVLDGAAWTDDFLEYDYIGARWPQHHDGMAVGNGGFSLRSTRLLNILATDPRFQPRPKAGEDELIGRDFRPALEREYGIRFAPESLADRFSVELSESAGPTFGFHGLFNMHRFVDSDEIRFIAQNADPATVVSGEFIGLCFRCLLSGHAAAAREIYARLREQVHPREIEAVLAHNGLSQPEAEEHVAFCESMLARAPIAG
ncbi:hypothetical protein AWB76_04441 [Caballeronia temeraria]|uniref:DUF5672 domain-containing protein n=1 Tax=Caballeronia temeraria TaxID=1777137 RepID=A0A158BMI2_9BURK|nr:DUF5672 family protein [Caballeronia temeraria]SAK71264.1 hypothetical protein AWB76_04441 [Caballeronia temeraria]